MDVDPVGLAGPSEEILRVGQVHEDHLRVQEAQPGVENRGHGKIAGPGRERSVGSRDDRRDHPQPIAQFCLERMRETRSDRDSAAR